MVMEALGRARVDRSSPVSIVALLLWASPAAAHIDEETLQRYGPFIAGVSHPVLGADHFLAMVAVGFVSAVLGRRDFWMVPACFVAVMPIGWVMGRLALPFPPVEVGIAVSVIGLGLGALFAQRLPVRAIYGAVALFALLHGYAHGRETPPGNVGQYAAGFLVGTALLHGIGLFIGDILHRPSGPNCPRTAISFGIVVAGLYFFVTQLAGPGAA